MQNTNYRNTFGISQSMIKDFKYMTPSQWRAKHVLSQQKLEREGEHLDYGSLVDTLMFSPEMLKKRFFIAPDGMKVPSDSIKNIIDDLYNEYCKDNIDEALITIGATSTNYAIGDLKDEIVTIAQRPQHNYGKGSYKPERIIKELTEKGGDYFELLKTIGDKVVISAMDNMTALNQAEVLRNHARTKPYFIQQEGETLLFQLELFVPHHEFDGPRASLIDASSENPGIVFKKGALDIVRINHLEKTIQIADFKTSFDAHNFLSSIKKYGYCRQLSYYHDIINDWKEVNYPDYEIIEPINIVIDKECSEPYIYEYEFADLEVEKLGYDNEKGRREGWETALATILWHLDTNIWSERELHQNNKIKIKLY